jgi:hypothetical protein
MIYISSLIYVYIIWVRPLKKDLSLQHKLKRFYNLLAWSYSTMINLWIIDLEGRWDDPILVLSRIVFDELSPLQTGYVSRGRVPQSPSELQPPVVSHHSGTSLTACLPRGQGSWPHIPPLPHTGHSLCPPGGGAGTYGTKPTNESNYNYDVNLLHVYPSSYIKDFKCSHLQTSGKKT